MRYGAPPRLRETLSEAERYAVADLAVRQLEETVWLKAGREGGEGPEQTPTVQFGTPTAFCHSKGFWRQANLATFNVGCKT
jgi:hypothetical protein